MARKILVRLIALNCPNHVRGWRYVLSAIVHGFERVHAFSHGHGVAVAIVESKTGKPVATWDDVEPLLFIESDIFHDDLFDKSPAIQPLAGGIPGEGEMGKSTGGNAACTF